MKPNFYKQTNKEQNNIMAISKTAEIVNLLIENFDYDKFVNDYKEEMDKMYRVPLGGMWLMGDTELTNEQYIQKRAKFLSGCDDSFNTAIWKGNIIDLIVRIVLGNIPKDTDLTEEKRKMFAERGM